VEIVEKFANNKVAYSEEEMNSFLKRSNLI